MRLAIVLAFLAAWAGHALSSEDVTRALALGRSCRAPIIVLSRPPSEFTVYIETAFARVALDVATATMMFEPLDSPEVTHAMNVEGVRIWTTRRGANAQVAVTAIRLESGGHTFGRSVSAMSRCSWAPYRRMAVRFALPL